MSTKATNGLKGCQSELNNSSEQLEVSIFEKSTNQPRQGSEDTFGIFEVSTQPVSDLEAGKNERTQHDASSIFEISTLPINGFEKQKRSFLKKLDVSSGVGKSTQSTLIDSSRNQLDCFSIAKSSKRVKVFEDHKKASNKSNLSFNKDDVSSLSTQPINGLKTLQSETKRSLRSASRSMIKNLSEMDCNGNIVVENEDESKNQSKKNLNKTKSRKKAGSFLVDYKRSGQVGVKKAIKFHELKNSILVKMITTQILKHKLDEFLKKKCKEGNSKADGNEDAAEWEEMNN